MNAIVLYSDPIAIPIGNSCLSLAGETRLEILIEYILGRNTIRNALIN